MVDENIVVTETSVDVGTLGGAVVKDILAGMLVKAENIVLAAGSLHLAERP